MEKKAKAGAAKAAGNDINPAGVEEAEQDNVDKIRDILFGNQMRELDRKFAKLEDRIASDLASMQQETAHQIESLQSFVESEVEILSDKIAAEEKTRIEQLDELDADLKKNVKQIDQKLAELGKALEKLSRDTNQKILKQSQDHSAELGKQMKLSRKRMDEYRDELSMGKVDKSILAEMLNGLAMQLNQDESGSK